MNLKNLSLSLVLGNVFIMGLNPKKLFHKIDNFKNLKWNRVSNIVMNKANLVYKNDNIDLFFEENKQYNKTLINLTPGGLKGFYNLGTCVYIKSNYDLRNCIFNGVSAGSWNGLVMCYKKNPQDFAIDIINSMKGFNNNGSIYNTQLYLKDKILSNYKSKDFCLDKLLVSVTCVNDKEIFTNIYTDFEDIEDAIDCCIASSNIPFVTGICETKYRDLLSLDGGFSMNPYINKKCDFEISPDMWYSNLYDKKAKKQNLYDMFFYNNYDINFHELYINGYYDAKNNNKLINLTPISNNH